MEKGIALSDKFCVNFVLFLVKSKEQVYYYIHDVITSYTMS